MAEVVRTAKARCEQAEAQAVVASGRERDRLAAAERIARKAREASAARKIEQAEMARDAALTQANLRADADRRCDPELHHGCISAPSRAGEAAALRGEGGGARGAPTISRRRTARAAAGVGEAGQRRDVTPRCHAEMSRRDAKPRVVRRRVRRRLTRRPDSPTRSPPPRSSLRRVTPRRSQICSHRTRGSLLTRQRRREPTARRRRAISPCTISTPQSLMSDHVAITWQFTLRGPLGAGARGGGGRARGGTCVVR